MRVVRFLLLASGVVLFAALLINIGPGAVVQSFAHLSWSLLLILWFPFVLVTLFDTLGWRYAFSRDRVPFRALLSTRMAGEAFNATTPTASVGGEGVKTWLLRGHVSVGESLTSVVVAKTTITIAQMLFLVVGVIAGPSLLPADSKLIPVMYWMLVIEVVAVGGFVLVQVSGMLDRLGRALAGVGLPHEGAQTLRELDESLVAFYRREPRRLLLSTLCHFLGWAFSAFEVYVILYFLDAPVPLLTAILIEAVGTGVRFASFMIPAHVGALEGGYVATFLALGLDPATALSFGLARRLREAAWVGLGFLLAREPRTPARAPAALAAEQDA